MSAKTSKLRYNQGKANTPGTLFETIDFSRNGHEIAPFKGGRFTIQPGELSKLDQHQVRECWVVAQGEGILNHDGTPVNISPGDYVFFDSMETHQVKNTGRDVLIIHSVWWDA